MSSAITLESQAFWVPPTQKKPLRCSKPPLSRKAIQSIYTQRSNFDEPIAISSDTDSDDESEKMKDDGNEQVHDSYSGAARQSQAIPASSTNPSTLDTEPSVQVAVPSDTSSPSQTSEGLSPSSTVVGSMGVWKRLAQPRRSGSEPTRVNPTKPSSSDRAASEPLEFSLQPAPDERYQPCHCRQLSTPLTVYEHHDAEIAETDYPIDPLLKDYEVDLREMVTNEAPGTIQAVLLDDAPHPGDEAESQGTRLPMLVPACVYPCTNPATPLPVGGLPSPVMSPPPAIDVGGLKDVAAFNEWPLKDAVLKRTIIDGRATFQLQFEWSVYTRHTEELGIRQKKKSRRTGTSSTTSSTASQGRNASSRRVKFSSEEDELLSRLKDDDLSWSEIHKRFTATYPGRSRGALQVRYCTKLNPR